MLLLLFNVSVFIRSDQKKSRKIASFWLWGFESREYCNLLKFLWISASFFLCIWIIIVYRPNFIAASSIDGWINSVFFAHSDQTVGIWNSRWTNRMIRYDRLHEFFHLIKYLNKFSTLLKTDFKHINGFKWEFNRHTKIVERKRRISQNNNLITVLIKLRASGPFKWRTC